MAIAGGTARADGREDTSDGVDVGLLFRAHGAFLLRVVERLLGRSDGVEDVVQRVFLIAHEKRLQLTAPDDLRGWLYRTAANVVRHDRRSRARRWRLSEAVATETSHAPDHAAGPDADMLARERGLQIRACIQKIPFEQREVFVLYELEELSGPEIGALLDVPENTVWSRLRLARARFRKAWVSQEARAK